MRKRGFLALTDERRRGRAPRETKAPGPRSSLNDERVRLWFGRTGGACSTVVDVEEEGSAGIEYGIAVGGGEMCGDCEGEVSKYISRASVLLEIPEEIPSWRGEIPREGGRDTGVLRWAGRYGTLMGHVFCRPDERRSDAPCLTSADLLQRLDGYWRSRQFQRPFQSDANGASEH